MKLRGKSRMNCLNTSLAVVLSLLAVTHLFGPAKTNAGARETAKRSASGTETPGETLGRFRLNTAHDANPQTMGGGSPARAAQDKEPATGLAPAPDSVTTPLPALTGSYAVGRRLFHWTDEAQVDADCPGGHREVAAWIWYPASLKENSTPAEWLPGEWGEAFWSSFVTSHPDAAGYGKRHPVRSVLTHAYADAPIAPGSPSYPVVLFAPGFGNNVLLYTALLEDLASHGYIVVGINPTHFTGFAVLSDGRVPEDRSSPPSDNPIGHLIQAHGVILGDAVFALKQLELLNADAGGPFRDRLDLEHVGSIGHSIGGSVAVHLASEDRRVVAAVNVDGTIAPGGTYPAKPLLILNHAGNELTPGDGFSAAAQAARPGYQLIVAGTTHNFSTDMGFMPFLPPSARNLVQPKPKMAPEGRTPTTRRMARGPEAGNDRPRGRVFGAPTPLVGSANPARTLAVTCAYVEAFFGHYLKGERTALLDGPSLDYPEVTFKSKPEASPQPMRSVGPGGPDFAIDAKDRAEALDDLVRALEQCYVYPEIGENVVKMIRERQERGEYDSITSSRALAHLLNKQMRDVAHDHHLGVMTLPPGKHMPKPGPEPRNPTPVPDFFGKNGNYGFERVEHLEGNLGYLKLNMFVGAEEEGGDIAAAAMTFLANSDALIIDLRGNGGGGPGMVQLLASYFFAGDPVHLNDMVFRRPGAQDFDVEQRWTQPVVAGPRYVDKEVYVLTGPHTFSAAEEFIYDLQALKRVTVVGEATGGGANMATGMPLGGRFAVNMPTGRSVNPITKTNWEGVGIKPDIEVPQEDALRTAQRTALEHLTAKTSDKGELFRFQMALNSLETTSESGSRRTTAPLPGAAVPGGDGVRVPEGATPPRPRQISQ